MISRYTKYPKRPKVRPILIKKTGKDTLLHLYFLNYKSKSQVFEDQKKLDLLLKYNSDSYNILQIFDIKILKN